MKKFLLIILSLAVIGGLAWYIDKNYLSQTVVSPTSTTPKPTETTSETMALTTEKLVFATMAGGAKEIDSITTDGQTLKKLFTDADEQGQIKRIDSLAQTSREAPLIFGENQLIALKLDGSGQYQTLVESLGNPPDIGLSADGKAISFITFSNVEVDFGYTLYVATRTGANLRGLVRNEKEMRQPFWSPDSKFIYYLQDKDNKTAVMKADVGNGQAQSIYETNENIYSLGATGDKIILSQGPESETQSAIYEITDNSNPRKILIEDGIIYYPHFSNDGLNIAYLLSHKATDEPSGEIFLASANGKNKKKLTQGIKILGWIP